MFDVVIIGAGVSGVSCALVLGSAQNKPFAVDKKIAIIKDEHFDKAMAEVHNVDYSTYLLSRSKGKVGFGSESDF